MLLYFIVLSCIIFQGLNINFAEYGMGGEASIQGDVYRILLLKMFTGKRPTNEIFKEDFNIHQKE